MDSDNVLAFIVVFLSMAGIFIAQVAICRKWGKWYILPGLMSLPAIYCSYFCRQAADGDWTFGCNVTALGLIDSLIAAVVGLWMRRQTSHTSNYSVYTAIGIFSPLLSFAIMVGDEELAKLVFLSVPIVIFAVQVAVCWKWGKWYILPGLLVLGEIYSAHAYHQAVGWDSLGTGLLLMAVQILLFTSLAAAVVGMLMRILERKQKEQAAAEPQIIPPETELDAIQTETKST